MDTTSGMNLPASIEAAWGLRALPSKGPKRGLNLDGIVAAAIQIAEVQGLAAVSMSHVAASLGVATMSLYRYVSAKRELLALMVDAAFAEPPVLGDGWRDGLSGWAWAEHAVFRRHPWVLRVPISDPPATPHQIAWLEAALACLRDTRLAENDKLSVVLLLGNFVRSEATLVNDMTAAFRAAGTASTQAMAAYGRLLARLIDPGRFPALTAVIDAGVFDAGDNPDVEFIFGLQRVLDGIAVLVESRR